MMRRKNFAAIKLTSDDIVENCNRLEIPITKAKANRLLELNEFRIMDAMVAAGWQVIEEEILSRNDGPVIE